MLKSNSRWLGLGFRILAIMLALVFTTIILVLTGASPFEAFKNIIVGSIGSTGKISDTLVAWVPLLLATSGLLVTFTVRFVEHRHRRPDHAGRNLYHVCPAILARFCVCRRLLFWSWRFWLERWAELFGHRLLAG